MEGPGVMLGPFSCASIAPATSSSPADTLKKRKPPPVRTGRGVRLECDRTKDHRKPIPHTPPASNSRNLSIARRRDGGPHELF